MAPAIAPTLAPHFCAQPAQPLSLDHSHRLRRLPRWPFLEIAARFHPLAGPPCRPIGRQGPGFDSPRRDGGRNLFVPPPLQRQALLVNAAPLVSVSSPPPRARCTLHRPPAPAYPPLEHDRPLLSTTSLLPPRVWQAVVLVGRTKFGSAQGAPPQPGPNPALARPVRAPPAGYGGGPLMPAAGAAPAPVALARAAPTPLRSTPGQAAALTLCSLLFFGLDSVSIQGPSLTAPCGVMAASRAPRRSIQDGAGRR